MVARPCKRPGGSGHELLSGFPAQMPYYKTHIKMHGQDLEVGPRIPPPPNSLPSPCFECICVHTPSDRTGSSCCHGAEKSHCFYTSSSRGKNHYMMLTLVVFLIFSCFSSCSHELDFFFFLSLLFVRLLQWKLLANWCLLLSAQHAESRAHLWLGASSSLPAEFMALLHLTGVDQKCKLEINTYLVNILWNT